MDEVICPNCKEKIKLVHDRKYVDCPYCKEEFKIGEESLLGKTKPDQPQKSLLDKLRGSK
jgi:sarcosine oxidase delta subunit